MGDDARRALGPRGLAICAGSGGTAWRRARRLDHGPKKRQSVFRPDQAPLRYWEGSTGVEPLRISKCNCGEVTLPVWPDLAITCPRFTGSPRLTVISLAWA